MKTNLLDIPKMFYRDWYDKDVSPHLDMEIKKKVIMRISDLTLYAPIWNDKVTNYLSDFPELAPYSHTGKLSGLQLVAVMEGMFKDLYPEASQRITEEIKK